jgi:hypothetical protein
LHRSGLLFRNKHSGQPVSKQPQAVSEVLVSKAEYGFLPASSHRLFQRLLYREKCTAFCLKEAQAVSKQAQPVSKVAVSGVVYGFLPENIQHISA